MLYLPGTEPALASASSSLQTVCMATVTTLSIALITVWVAQAKAMASLAAMLFSIAFRRWPEHRRYRVRAAASLSSTTIKNICIRGVGPRIQPLAYKNCCRCSIFRKAECF